MIEFLGGREDSPNDGSGSLSEMALSILAKDMVEELERRQAETERELAAWREGIAAVEAAVRLVED